MQLADQFRALGAGMSLKVSSLLLVAGEGDKPVSPFLPRWPDDIARLARRPCLGRGNPLGEVPAYVPSADLLPCSPAETAALHHHVLHMPAPR